MKIAVLSVGHTKFGELWEKSLKDLLAESQLEALNEANLDSKDIDQIITGNFCSSIFNNQSNIAAIAAEILNINVPSIVTENACASGGAALRQAILTIFSGQAKVVMVNGVEKMTDLSTEQITSTLAKASSYNLEQFYGTTFASLFAMITRAYMHKYKLTREQLAQISVTNHNHGFKNQLAHFRKKITIEHVINSPIVADPLTLFDCSPISDGSASIILSTPKFAKKLNIKPVFIIGSAQATDIIALQNRISFTEFKAIKITTQNILKQTKLNIKDVDVIELHDGFSIVEIIALEDLGITTKGQTGKIIEKNKNILNNINPSGGLKSKGHPIGATGISQVIEIVKQLQNKSSNQIQNANIGLTLNLGGIASTAIMHILVRDTSKYK